MAVAQQIPEAGLEHREGANRPFPFWPTLLAIPGIWVAGFVAAMCCDFIVGIFAGDTTASDSTAGGLADNLESICSYLITIGLTLLAWKRLSGRSLADIGLRRIGWGAVGIALLAVVIDFCVSLAISLACHRVHVHTGAQSGWEEVTHDPAQRLVLVLVACVLDPIGEELFFRGLLVNALQSRMPGIAAVLLAAVLFGAAHEDAVYFAALTCSGVIFTAVYRKTGSLYASMITHGVSNALSLALMFAR